MKANVIIHPGFMKSATSTLQVNLFEKHENIIAIGRPFYHNKSSLIRQEIGRIKGIGYKEGIVKSIRDEIMMESVNKEDCVVWSDETLVQNAYTRYEIAKRMKSIFPEAKIIFTIRNQISAIESYYGNHGRVLRKVPVPYDGKFVSINNWLEYAYRYIESSFLGTVDYFNTIQIYRDIFGSDNVHIFLFEEMVNDLPIFSDRMANVLSLDFHSVYSLLKGQHEHKRASERFVTYTKIRSSILHNIKLRELSFLNPIRKRIYSYINGGNAHSATISKDWIERLNKIYKDGNKKILEDTKLPLDKYRYPL
jgi:hypothetical protein